MIYFHQRILVFFYYINIFHSDRNDMCFLIPTVNVRYFISRRYETRFISSILLICKIWKCAYATHVFKCSDIESDLWRLCSQCLCVYFNSVSSREGTLLRKTQQLHAANVVSIVLLECLCSFSDIFFMLQQLGIMGRKLETGVERLMKPDTHVQSWLVVTNRI